MGQIVGAAMVSHHPGLFRPQAQRIEAGNGVDSDLIAGFERIRSRIDAVKPDTLVIFDTHWFSTLRFVLAGAAQYKGIFTSHEMPWILHDIPYDYPGAPELSARIARIASERGVPVENTTNPHIEAGYASINLLGPLWRGEKVLSASICQNALVHHFIAMGEVIGAAIRHGNDRVVLLASGALSHRMVDLDFVPPNPNRYSSDNVSSPTHVQLDREIMASMAAGDHETVIRRYPELRAAAFEGLGGHYLQMIGALGGNTCRLRGEQLSAYENALGTGNVHMWFDPGSTVAP